MNLAGLALLLVPALVPVQQIADGEARACDGCPRRSVARALWQTTAINGIYELGNLIRGQVTARITPKTWWANLEQGWVWDLDDFGVNQIGHPYQGSNYFNAARANGLDFYEAAAVTAFGSFTWEYFGETNHASINDFINTTLGGIALGEMFHRAAWLVRDTRATGRTRLWRELAATAIDPITGANRFMTGDARRVAGRPPGMTPTSLGAVLAAGVLWRGSGTDVAQRAARPFLDVDLRYGDTDHGHSRTPYEAFSVRLRFGGGAALSDARVRGRLLGRSLTGGTHLMIMHSYDFQANEAYRTGSQSLEMAVSHGQALPWDLRFFLLTWAGATVLGAVDALPLGLDVEPDEEDDPDAGQGVSEGPRFYDYGPGANAGAYVSLSYGARLTASLFYEGRFLYSLDGVRANHFLQRARLDLTVPVTGAIGAGAAAEYFDRQTLFKTVERADRRFHYPQFRVYLTWQID